MVALSKIGETVNGKGRLNLVRRQDPLAHLNLDLVITFYRVLLLTARGIVEPSPALLCKD